MKKTLKNVHDELISVNDELYLDFSIDELEERLETDPLLLANLFDLDNDGCDKCKCHNGCNGHCSCNTDGSPGTCRGNVEVDV